MNCRTFRKHHVAYVDDLVSGFARTQMEEHLRSCASCASNDARVRRSLLLVRNLPPIEPSAAFRDRLHSELIARALLPERTTARRMRYGAIAAAAAVLVVVGGTVGAFARATAPVTLTLPPAVATAPAISTSPAEPSVLARPAVMASFSTGLALWPAALVADEAAEFFVHAAFAQDELTR